MKLQKRMLALLLIALLLLSACAPSTSPTEAQPSEASTTEADVEPTETKAEPTEEETAEPTEPTKEEEETTTEPADAENDGEFDGKLHGPFVMTTCGQSAGSVMFHVVATQAGLTSVDEHQLLEREMDTVAAGAKTLVITTGTSGKGMGAAGTDVNSEIERCTAVANKAKEMGMTIVCAHIEGMSRRTDANDQSSIDAILPLADVIVCVEQSNSDNYFSDYAEANDIPIIIVPDTMGLGDYLS